MGYRGLGLSEGQVRKLYKIRTDYKARLAGPGNEVKRLKSEEREAMEKVLSAEQLKRLREVQTGEKAPGR